MRLSTIHPPEAPEIINVNTRIYGCMKLGKDQYLDTMFLEVKRLWENGDREARAHVVRREFQVKSVDGRGRLKTETRSVWYVSLDWLEEIHKSLFAGWSMPVRSQAGRVS